jgi:hypothetical protein
MVELRTDRHEHLLTDGWVGLDDLEGLVEPHADGDEILLEAIVEVALEAPPLGIGGVD